MDVTQMSVSLHDLGLAYRKAKVDLYYSTNPSLFDIANSHRPDARPAANFMLSWWNAAACGGFDLQDLRQRQDRPLQVTSIFLDATTDTLVRRFSETRRAHPLSVAQRADGDHQSALIEAIERERELLAELRDQSLVLDTSLARPLNLRQQLQDLVGPEARPLTLVFESFAFKRGIPMDADFVFDVRMLPNPHYEPGLKPQTGRDVPVAAYLQGQEEVRRMQAQITEFLEAWLPSMVRDHRSYVTVALGCTGGQHRSVYLAEQLARHFKGRWTLRVRHRESDHWPRSGRD